MLLCLNDSVSQMRRNWPSCRQSDSSILDYEAINHNDLVGGYTANFCTYECAQLMVNHIVVYHSQQVVLLHLCTAKTKFLFLPQNGYSHAVVIRSLLWYYRD